MNSVVKMMRAVEETQGVWQQKPEAVPVKMMNSAFQMMIFALSGSHSAQDGGDKTYRIYRIYRVYWIYRIYRVYWIYWAYRVYRIYRTYRAYWIYRTYRVYWVYWAYWAYLGKIWRQTQLCAPAARKRVDLT